MDKFGLPLLTVRLLSHEAAHVARFATLPNHESHPRWVVDGVASRAEERVLIEKHLIESAESDPLFSTYMVDAQALAAANRLPSMSSILRDDLGELSTRSMYGIRWLWTRFLCESAPDAWTAIAGEIRRKGGGGDYAAAIMKVVEDNLRPTMPDADGKFRAYVKSLRPAWEEVYRSLSVEGSIWKQAAFADSNAIAWRTARAGRSDYRLSGQLRILGGGKEQMNLLMARSPAGFVSVAFVAGFGVTVFHYDAGSNQWNKLGESKCADVVNGPWLDFSVGMSTQTITVQINEKAVLTVDSPSIALDGPWGVGAQAGSCGVWNQVELH